MKFTIFRTAKAQKGELCTYERYLELSNSPELLRLCNDIAAEEDADKRGELKKKLPAITWQAYFAGNSPWRCHRCVFNRCKIDKCFRVACQAEEREDKKNVYFEYYEYR